ncbi:MAG: gamma-glutamyltransferase [Alphaproteobacteria bacterium]|uniref:gamma-glutamyltransferase n=1 Tax=Brevundimonas sp. TaxID=1871086 RepID=UPI001DD6162E|nr:gamma-glutamyltransferase [Alphaproteobacteria bacterium]MBU1520890.1 gamma-glutamyltransferase [Alphaproteobacteria bacterium]MBU2030848.1 gamma-glutamyltransferase [Alphaproteobacteria bacterium]MBU2165965.1 gamma-glutamyltransferase [Alphaproteobacteria bacterium]MBU2230384.1 gamma-glutamyltransferase [Alphaproteobacteria bacterium]
MSRRQRLLPAVFAAFLALAPSVRAQDRPQALLNYEAVHHPVISTTSLVVSQNDIASRVGAEILAKGGNAVDAAVATGFALAVTLPRAGNLGGDGFMLVYVAAEDRTYALDYRSTAPLAARPALYDQAPQDARYGYRAPGVPGTVAGLAHAHARWGRLPWAELIEPARKLAAEGVTLSHDSAYALSWSKDVIGRWEAGRGVFLQPDGSSWRPGDTLVQSDLAWTLGEIQRDGADAFYKGAVADRIVASMQAHGGLITHEDLARYRPAERTPIETDYRGHRVVTMPPSSAGGVMLLELLNLVERFDLKAMGADTAASLHVMSEAMKLAQLDRTRYIGDPDFSRLPTAQLTSQAYADGRSALISTDRVLTAPRLVPGDPWEVEGIDTTHFSVVDGEGNAVSNTYTLGSSFGSGAVVDGAGFLLNDQMKNFNRRMGPDGRPVTANGMEPGKRMISTMAPTIVFKDGRPWLVTGTPGGSTIPNSLFQLIVNVVDHGMNIAEATTTPRVHQDGATGDLQVESGLNRDTIRLLEALGHEVEVGQTIGSSQSILIGNGLLMGAADPRRPDSAAVVP